MPVLHKEQLAADPFRQFDRWFSKVQKNGLDRPDAVCLSTAGPDGEPQGRMVLLKGFDERGFVFYTDRRSAKGQALAADPRAALTFYWDPFPWQVRVSGRVAEVSKEEADAYFAVRPRGSQLGAWASRQDEVLKDRKTLEGRWAEATLRYRGGPVPRPEHWTGFRISPDWVEFWQARPSRLHDRFRYSRTKSGWKIERISP